MHEMKAFDPQTMCAHVGTGSCCVKTNPSFTNLKIRGAFVKVFQFHLFCFQFKMAHFGEKILPHICILLSYTSTWWQEDHSEQVSLNIIGC